MDSLGADYEIMGYGDFGLAMMPFRNLAMPLLNLLRQKDFAAIFSFHPYEITPNFDHPDHNIAGEAARFAAAGQDVENLKTGPYIASSDSYGATESRPELYLWTTDKSKATHKQKLTKKSRKKRNKYLQKQYPSQFPRQSKKRWGRIFDKITENGKSHSEFYQQVR